MACPYIYPPVSRYADLDASVLYGGVLDFAAPPALYLHIPFCIYRCHFCNFALDVLKHASASVDDYLAALELELARNTQAFGGRTSVCSIHIGGGTPSVLNAAQLRALFALLRKHFILQPGGEFCMEVTPDTVRDRGSDKLRVLSDAGINRISIGAQVMDDAMLLSLNRRHTASMVDDALDAARTAGIARANIDLMYALPGLTLDGWAESLSRTADARPDSISIYQLRIPPHSSLTEVAQDRHDDVLLQQAMAILAMHDAGYVRSMPNQFVLDESMRQAHYVDVREQLRPLLAAGVSAIGFLNDFVFQGPLSLAEYMIQSRSEGVRYRGVRLSDPEQMARAAILGLKSPRGVSLRRFSGRFGGSFDDVFGDIVEFLSANGLIERCDDYLRTTDVGSMFVDRIASLFFPRADIAHVQERETAHLGVYWH